MKAFGLVSPWSIAEREGAARLRSDLRDEREGVVDPQHMHTIGGTGKSKDARFDAQNHQSSSIRAPCLPCPLVEDWQTGEDTPSSLQSQAWDSHVLLVRSKNVGKDRR